MKKTKPTPKDPRGRKPTYPWDEWFAKKQFAVKKGVDYRCQTKGMVQMIRSRASERGLSVRTQKDGTTIRAWVK